MKLPTIKRIRKEDFDKKYDDLLTGLLFSINTFFESVANGLNKNITFTDNIAGQVKELTIKAPVTSVEFKREFSGNCTGVIIAEIVPEKTDELFASAPFVQFINTNNGIKITNITGLTSGNTYRIRLICLAGP